MSTKWSQAEDIALTKAYIEVSEDNVVGVGQAQDTLWARTIIIMYALLDSIGHQYERRSKYSITSRWKKHICSKMQKWNEALQRASREVGSGGQIMDEHELALHLYKAETKQHLCFQHTWEVAKDWIMFKSTSQTPLVNPSQPTKDCSIPTPPPKTQFESETLGDDDHPETPHVPQSSERSERPIGNKNAKKGKGKAWSSSLYGNIDFEGEKFQAMRETTLLVETGQERRHMEML